MCNAGLGCAYAYLWNTLFGSQSNRLTVFKDVYCPIDVAQPESRKLVMSTIALVFASYVF